jgi:predicted deacylase
MKKSVTFGDVTVEPGEIGFGSLTTVELADSTPVKLPIIVMNGSEDGPKFLFSGAVHGGELIGANVVRRVMREELDPKKLKGLVVAIPVGNPLGFMFGDRASPQDLVTGPRFGQPGNIEGSITQRFGAAVWDQITSKMDFRVDIHGNYPPCTAFCLCSLHDDRIKDKNTEMAEATGLTVVYSPPRGTLDGMGGALDPSFTPPPSITLELIDARRVTEVSTDLGTRAILNVMKLRGMIEGEIEKQPDKYVWGGGRVKNGGTIRASRGGIIHFTRTPGEFIKKEEVVAKIYNPWGDLVEKLQFPFNGYIRAYTYPRHQAINTGDTIAYITHDE